MIGQETDKRSDALPRLVLRDQEFEHPIGTPGLFIGQRQQRIPSPAFALPQPIANLDASDAALTVLESILAGVAGAGLGGVVQGPVGAVMGGLNGVISGAKQIYDWSSWTGWAAFVADSSWGLIGTELGVVVHTINLFYDRKYRNDLSFRQNRHVYDGGFAIDSAFSFTQGNVTSNLAGGGGGTELLNHESLHIFQNRLFGPIYLITYGAWLIVGGVVGGIFGIFASQPWTTSVQDVAYFDNLWETWAYKVEGPKGQHGGDLSWV
jgi:hypothetical protein